MCLCQNGFVAATTIVTPWFWVWIPEGSSSWKNDTFSIKMHTNKWCYGISHNDITHKDVCHKCITILRGDITHNIVGVTQASLSLVCDLRCNLTEHSCPGLSSQCPVAKGLVAFRAVMSNIKILSQVKLARLGLGGLSTLQLGNLMSMKHWVNTSLSFS